MPINKGIAINKGNPKNCHFRVRSPSRAFFFTFLGVFCVCTYIWKILKLKHFPKKINPIYKNKILTNNSLKVYNCNECLIK